MLTTDQKNSILYQSQVWVAETGYKIMEKEQYSDPCDREYDLAFKILNYQMVLLDPDVSLTLSEKQLDYIYRCIQDSLNLMNYPVAPLPFAMVESVDILIGTQGPPGIPGAPGTNGTDANINVITTDPQLQVIESVVLGVKTFDIKLFLYTEPTLIVVLDNASIPDPDQHHVVEIGVVIPVLPLNITLTKGRDNVTASTMLLPVSLAATYAAEVDLPFLNSNGSQLIILNLSNVDEAEVFQVNITDGTETNVASDSITFVYPFLYGSSAGLLTTTHYQDLNKLIQTQGDKSVLLQGVNEYFWFGFPADYDPLTEIYDQNGFLVTGAWTEVNPVLVSSSGLDNNWALNYRFYRTTVPTTIDGIYTFKF
jgi:hypothetical protein